MILCIHIEGLAKCHSEATIYFRCLRSVIRSALSNASLPLQVVFCLYSTNIEFIHVSIFDLYLTHATVRRPSEHFPLISSLSFVYKPLWGIINLFLVWCNTYISDSAFSLNYVFSFRGANNFVLRCLFYSVARFKK